MVCAFVYFGGSDVSFCCYISVFFLFFIMSSYCELVNPNMILWSMVVLVAGLMAKIGLLSTVKPYFKRKKMLPNLHRLTCKRPNMTYNEAIHQSQRPT
jgi:hypothetical protein